MSTLLKIHFLSDHTTKFDELSYTALDMLEEWAPLSHGIIQPISPNPTMHLPPTPNNPSNTQSSELRRTHTLNNDVSHHAQTPSQPNHHMTTRLK